jgi:hypothetical protein
MALLPAERFDSGSAAANQQIPWIALRRPPSHRRLTGLAGFSQCRYQPLNMATRDHGEADMQEGAGDRRLSLTGFPKPVRITGIPACPRN